MRPQCCCAVAAFLLVVMLPVQARKSHHHKLTKHLHKDADTDNGVHPEKRNEAHNFLRKHNENEECHRAALQKCGHTFLRAHKLLRYLGEETIAFRTKCAIRTAFLECLKVNRERLCRRRPKQSRATVDLDAGDFKKRLTDALWGSRDCVIRVGPF